MTEIVESVKIVTLSSPIKAFGKTLSGDYAMSPAYITQVRNLLTRSNIEFIPNKVLGVYYDDPRQTAPDALRSFQGVFILEDVEEKEIGLTKTELKGKYIYTSVAGDPMQAVYEGYQAIFTYVQAHAISLRSPAGYQVSTFENDILTIEIYMEVE